MKSDFQSDRVGLCATCNFAKTVISSKEHLFYYCRLSETSPAFAKYPRLPVRHCSGFESQTAQH